MKFCRLFSLLFLGLGYSMIAMAGQFYLGLDGGVNFFTLDKKVTNVISGPAPSQSSPTYSEDETNAVFGVYMGYGQRLYSGVYLGVEATADWSDIDIKTSASDASLGVSNPVSLREENDFTFGLSFIPGYFVTNNIKLYARAGFIVGRFKSSSNYAGRFGFTGKFTQWDPGFVAGAGIEAMLTRNVSARLEYDYRYYAEFTKRSSVISGPFAQSVTTKYEPTMQLIVAGLTYSF